MKVFNPAKIRERRKKLKLTQEQLSQLAKLSRIHLIDIEMGRKIPSAAVIAKLSDALKVRVNYFFKEV